MSNTGKVFNFIQFSEINEGLDDEGLNPTPAAAPAPALPAPAQGAGELPEPAPTEGGEGEGEELEPGQDGGPQIIKVYTNSEEDLQELRDAGIDVDGIGGEEGEEGAEPTEGGEETPAPEEGEGAPVAESLEDGTEAGAENPDAALDEPIEGVEDGGEPAEGEEETPAATSPDVLYVKIRTEDGEDVILPFTEENEENRTPVEGEENTFDTELVATHNDYEFRITAEIKVNPTTGEEEGKPEVESDEQVEEQPIEGDEAAEAGVDQGADDNTEPITPNESVKFKANIVGFTQFVAEGKREVENYKKAKQWEKALSDGKKKMKKGKKVNENTHVHDAQHVIGKIVEASHTIDDLVNTLDRGHITDDFDEDTEVRIRDLKRSIISKLSIASNEMDALYELLENGNSGAQHDEDDEQSYADDSDLYGADDYDGE